MKKKLKAYTIITHVSQISVNIKPKHYNTVACYLKHNGVVFWKGVGISDLLSLKNLIKGLQDHECPPRV